MYITHFYHTKEGANMFSVLEKAFGKHAAVDLANTVCSACSNIWVYGMHPTITKVTHTPNGLGMWKTLCAGETKWILFKTSTLVSALRTILNVDIITFDMIAKEVEKCATADRLKELKTNGCEIYFCTQGKLESVWVPTGWLIAEMVCKGPLIYGVRKSTVLQSTTAHSEYECLISLFAASKAAGVDSMRKALQLMVCAE